MKNLFLILITFLTVSATAQTSNELLMVKEINELRANPKSFIPLVEKYISFQSSTKNIAAAKELIEVLTTIGPLDTLIFNVDMYEITKVHGEYLNSVNKVSHKNASGDNASKRFTNVNVENVSENVSNVGSIRKNTFKSVIVSLLIDAGIESRGHRNNLLNPDAKFISVFVGEKICVQNFAN